MVHKPYQVQLLPTAQKEMDKLPQRIHASAISLIKQLSSNPRPVGCRKLKGTYNVFRVGMGDYRIIYRVIDKDGLVSVGHVLHRSKAYG
jgi:mRNA interferase RelE/StbE